MVTTVTSVVMFTTVFMVTTVFAVTAVSTFSTVTSLHEPESLPPLNAAASSVQLNAHGLQLPSGSLATELCGGQFSPLGGFTGMTVSLTENFNRDLQARVPPTTYGNYHSYKTLLILEWECWEFSVQSPNSVLRSKRRGHTGLLEDCGKVQLLASSILRLYGPTGL
ncbi:hypothetical protein DPEC_G00279790 [Dallia pectoralis]|uniref:Uncharacterized protein n=1 Tax=Dallia pectoralis TaxID=75939 RepID=A0ACC2FMD6_DALPE|nr:hypothetical protein DPEC_G00279790 [Dallia pectoralis]